MLVLGRIGKPAADTLIQKAGIFGGHEDPARGDGKHLGERSQVEKGIGFHSVCSGAAQCSVGLMKLDICALRHEQGCCCENLFAQALLHPVICSGKAHLKAFSEVEKELPEVTSETQDDSVGMGILPVLHRQAGCLSHQDSNCPRLSQGVVVEY